MSATEVHGPGRDAAAGTVDMRLEVQIIPVSGVDRTEQFYQRLGWQGPAPGLGVQDRVGRKLISDENQVVSNGTLTQVGGDLLTDSRYLIGPPVERALICRCRSRGHGWYSLASGSVRASKRGSDRKIIGSSNPVTDPPGTR